MRDCRIRLKTPEVYDENAEQCDHVFQNSEEKKQWENSEKQ
jgi:hypothetical protein